MSTWANGLAMTVPAMPAPNQPLLTHRWLRAQAWVAIGALLLYGGLSFGHLTALRSHLFDSMQALQQLLRHDKALALTEAAVGVALQDVDDVARVRATPAPPAAEIDAYMTTCDRLFESLAEFDPDAERLQHDIAQTYADLQAAPLQANWSALRESLGRAADGLEIRRATLAERGDALRQVQQSENAAITREALLLALLGLALSGVALAWFFNRLGGELRRVELEGEVRSHQDKMRAVGALAAGVAHEVNNPLAVIAGVAQELNTVEGEVPAQRITDAARLILAQTQRAAQATRQLAEAAAPLPTEVDWVDLNALVRRAVRLLSFDKRYRQLGFESDLGVDVPALKAPAAALQQVLMQLLTLGCDAAVSAPQGLAWVRIATRRTEGGVQTCLEFPVPLDRKHPEVQRTLLRCRTMIEPLGAQLAIGQDALPLGHIKLAWPAEPGGA